MKIVIADASCLIALDNINESDLLPQLYSEIIVTPEVANEVGDALPEWARVRSSSNRVLIDDLCLELEIGEASSIALALEVQDCILIIDEKKGRRRATTLGLEITGTVGVIASALDVGIVADPSTIVGRLERAGFHISDILNAQLDEKVH